MKVVSLVERNGKKRSFHVAHVTAKTVTPILKAQIAEKSRLMTDETSVYNQAGQAFASHEKVNHSAKEYVRGDVTTNTVESSFAILAGTPAPSSAFPMLSALRLRLRTSAASASLIGGLTRKPKG